MPRFYIPPEAWDPAHLFLSDAEAHHCRDVLRMNSGEQAVVFNGLGWEAAVELMKLGRDQVQLRTVAVKQSHRAVCQITIGQAIPKGKNMELIIEKATELGAAAIAPLLTTRTVVQLNAIEAVRKQEKWQRVAVEAAKQCGQNWLPQVHLPQSPQSFFAAHGPFDLMLVGSLESDARPLKKILSSVTGPTSVLILIGPEGDFTPAELKLARDAGCQPISFGPIILRSETAAIYSLSVLRHEMTKSE